MFAEGDQINKEMKMRQIADFIKEKKKEKEKLKQAYESRAAAALSGGTQGSEGHKSNKQIEHQKDSPKGKAHDSHGGKVINDVSDNIHVAPLSFKNAKV